jgi:hypothetical protein
MTSVSSLDTKKAKKSAFSFILWWRVDPAEIERQIKAYHTLRVWQSARGMSALLCVLTVAATAVLGKFIRLSTNDIVAEAVVWLTIAIFMYRGHRWAFIVGMILWTIEKAMLLFGGVAAAPIVHIIWWAIYMQAFFLGFKVESRRAALPVIRR